MCNDFVEYAKELYGLKIIMEESSDCKTFEDIFGKIEDIEENDEIIVK